MEKFTRLVLVAVVIFSPMGLMAIPNVIGGFFAAAGMRFEEFAVKPETWQRDATMPGDWEAWNDESVLPSDNIEVLKLKQNATVFGIEADEVVAYRKDETLQKLRISFADDAQTGSSLKTNLKLWSDPEHGVRTSLDDGNVVTIEPAR